MIKMTLLQILQNKNNIRVKEYERFGNGVIFIGGFYYTNKHIIALDRNTYLLSDEPSVYSWEDSTTLAIMR
jgi:hypothetical protein